MNDSRAVPTGKGSAVAAKKRKTDEDERWIYGSGGADVQDWRAGKPYIPVTED